MDEIEEKLVSEEKIDIEVENKEFNKEIYKILDKFKKEDKDIFIYYYYYKYKVKEISILLGVSESKVKTKLFRIRSALRKKLDMKEDIV